MSFIQSWTRASAMTEFLKKNKLASAGLVIVSLLTFVAIFAPWLAPYDPRLPVGEPLTPPGPGHRLGTNDLGQDVLSQLVYGTRTTLIVAAWLAQPGCELSVLSNAILRRDDQIGCFVFTPIDELERRLSARTHHRRTRTEANTA